MSDLTENDIALLEKDLYRMLQRCEVAWRKLNGASNDVAERAKGLPVFCVKFRQAITVWFETPDSEPYDPDMPLELRERKDFEVVRRFLDDRGYKMVKKDLVN